MLNTLIPATQVRKELGGISQVTLWRWVKKGVIPPPVKLNGRKYWRQCDVEDIKNGQH